MFVDPEQTFTQLAKLYFGLKNRSQGALSIWKKVLDDLFHSIPDQNRKYIFGKQWKSKFKSSEDFSFLIHSFPPDVLPEIRSVLVLIAGQLETAREISARYELDGYIEVIDKYFEESSVLKEKAEIVTNRLEENLNSFRNRKTISIPTSIHALIGDYLLRWIVLWIYQANHIEFNEIFYLLQAIFIPGLTMLYGYFRSQRNMAIANRLIVSYGGSSSFNIKMHRTSTQYTLLAVMALSGIFIGFTLENELEIRILALVGISAGFLIYYSVFLHKMSVGRLKETEFFRQKDEWKHLDRIGDPDLNDEILVEVESRLKSVASRLDAYVLESAILGALSFSGFLQIMAERLITFNNLRIFGASLYHILVNVVQFQPGLNQVYLEVITSQTGLFSMVAVETLVCSIFFLTVIAARLRFSNIGDQVGHSLSVAKAFNQKEELVLEKKENDRPSDRMTLIGNRIKESLFEAIQGLENITPVNNFIEYFRNAGLGTFFIILVSCSLFISSILAWIFTILALFIIIYFNWKNFRSVFKIMGEKYNSLFINYEIQYFIISLAVIFLGFINRYILHFKYGGLLWPIGIILYALFFIMQIIIYPVEERKNHSRGNIKEDWWPVIKWIFSMGVFLLLIGLIFKILHLPGAGISLIFGTIINILFGLFLVFKIVDRNWNNYTVGVCFLINFITMAFKLIHFENLVPLMFISYSILFTGLVVALIKFRKTHLLLRYAIIMDFFMALILLNIPARFT